MDAEKLNKYFRGDSSQAEKEEVQLWLEKDEKNRREFISLRTLYDITLGVLSEDLEQQQSIHKRNKDMIFDWMKIAAAVILTFMVSYYYVGGNNGEVEMQTLHVPAGQRAELTLADGTRVWLNALTTLTFPSQFTKSARKVYLDGEAYFDVKHEDDKKFTVNIGKYNINVLGTEFNVAAYSKKESFETSLIKGAVEIESVNGEKRLLLTPGNKAYLKGNNLAVVPIQDYDLFLWKDGVISFKNERIEDILYKLELYYDVEIYNEKNSIKDIRYTGKFRVKDGIEHVLTVLKIPTGMDYVKDNGDNKIIIK